MNQLTNIEIQNQGQIKNSEGEVRTFKRIYEHYSGWFLLTFLRIYYSRFVQMLAPLADYLENRIFPTIREREDNALEIWIDQPDEDLIGRARDKEYQFPHSSYLSKHLANCGIRRVTLDVRLESGQIIESLLVLLFVRSSPKWEGFSVFLSSEWRRLTIKRAMHNKGFLKFCALMRLDEQAQHYNVTYSYCELFFSKVIRGYLQNRARFRDHRVLLSLAPKIALLALVLLILPVLVGFFYPNAGWILWGIVTFFMGGTVWLGIHTLGSLQYDREYFESLSHEFTQQLSQLSRFPETNPHPIFRMDSDGHILFANPAANKLLSEVETDTFSDLMPDDLCERIRQLLERTVAEQQIEVERFKKTIRYLMVLYPDRKSILMFGTDITRLRDTERLLKNLNFNFSTLLRSRTEQLRKTQDVTILSLAGLAETRDPETGRHLERTRRYVKALAEFLKKHPRFRYFLNDTMIEKIYNSTPLHDIGKVGIPDSILLKPGRLTPEEFDEMKKHTLFGGRALQLADEKLGFDSFLRVGKDIAISHHERWDGAGYPYGLQGDDIPIPARLMAVADVYDALVSRRPYKEPFSHQTAREIIEGDKGTHFDPDVVDAFVAVDDQFQQIAQDFAEME